MIGAEGLLLNRQGAHKQRFGFPVAALIRVGGCKIDQGSGDGGMLMTEDSLVDLESPKEKCLRRSSVG